MKAGALWKARRTPSSVCSCAARTHWLRWIFCVVVSDLSLQNAAIARRFFYPAEYDELVTGFAGLSLYFLQAV